MRETLLALMTPTTVLALVIGTLLAGVFHCLTVTKGSRLLVSWTIGVAAFCVGVILSEFLNIDIFAIGPMDIVLPSIFSIAAMSVARLIKL